MTTLLNRVAQSIWTFRQPLTKRPTLTSTPLSDLFLWRDDDDWQTYFELTDMVGMFGNGDGSRGDVSAELVFFNPLGHEIGRKTVIAPLFKRKVLSIGELIGTDRPSMGTFCVLHKRTPDGIKALGSSLTERGYVSFRYRNAPLRSYVHGNLDAVANGAYGQVERLGGVSLLPREYRLQYELRRGRKYEIALVNASSKQQSLVCELLDNQTSNHLVKNSRADLPPGGCHAFTIIPEQESTRIVIKSRLVMARPLVFCFDGNRLDALHG